MRIFQRAKLQQGVFGLVLHLSRQTALLKHHREGSSAFDTVEFGLLKLFGVWGGVFLFIPPFFLQQICLDCWFGVVSQIWEGRFFFHFWFWDSFQNLFFFLRGGDCITFLDCFVFFLFFCCFASSGGSGFSFFPLYFMGFFLLLLLEVFC